MNDQDLERELRSQRSPREDGYAPTRLPMKLEDGTPAGPRRSMVPRAALFAGAALAGALAVAVVAGIMSGPGPDVGNDGSPSAQPTALVTGDCGPSDVALSAEPWGGAAGSRGTVVTVALAAGASPCDLPLPVRAEIVDANGKHLVKGASPTASGSVALGSGTSLQLGVAWSNWCGAQPAAPMTLFLGFGNQVPVSVGATGSVPATAVPPCNGDGPSTLSQTDLQPQS
jgi:hypothetical protein